VVALLDPQPGEDVLDACAAPGGKTLFAAARMQGQVGHLTDALPHQTICLNTPASVWATIHAGVCMGHDSALPHHASIPRLATSVLSAVAISLYAQLSQDKLLGSLSNLKVLITLKHEMPFAAGPAAGAGLQRARTARLACQ